MNTSRTFVSESELTTARPADALVPSRAVQTQIAASAGCDVQTVTRYFRGAPVHSTTRQCIERALRARHLPVRPKPSSGPSGAAAPTAA